MSCIGLLEILLILLALGTLIDLARKGLLFAFLPAAILMIVLVIILVVFRFPRR